MTDLIPALPLPLAPKDLVDPSLSTLVTLWRSWPTDSIIRRGMALSALVAKLDGEGDPGDERLYFARQGQASRTMRLLLLESGWKTVRLAATATDHAHAHAGEDAYPLQVVYRLKNECTVRRIGDVVRTAADLNERGSRHFGDGKMGAAIEAYLHALAWLCPWSCDRSIMTFDQAQSTGLATVEQEVLLNIARAGLAWSSIRQVQVQDRAHSQRQPQRNRNLDDHLFPTLVDAALQAFEFFPFTTWAGQVAHSDLLRESIARWPAYYAPERKQLFQARRAARAKWLERGEGWAHRDCQGRARGHICYALDLVEQARQAQSA